MQNLVQIHDNLFSELELRHIYLWCKNVPYYYNQSSDTDVLVDRQTRFSHPFDPKKQCDYVYERITEKILSIVDYQLECVHSYVNFYDFSTPTVIHPDVDFTNIGVTALFFTTRKWDPNWGGEIIFYDDQYEVSQAVSYKPNRVLFFDSGLLHGVKQPSVNAQLPRYSIAFKYDILRNDKV